MNHYNKVSQVNFEVRFDRTELFTKKTQNNQKVRARFAVTNSYLIRFGITFLIFPIFQIKNLSIKSQIYFDSFILSSHIQFWLLKTSLFERYLNIIRN